MKNKLLILLMLVSSTMFSQIGISKKDDILEIQKRTLIVVLEEANPKLTQKLEGDVLKQYKKDIDDYNSGIKEAIALVWKFNSKIEYKTRAEIEKLTKAKSKNYAYIEYNKFTTNCATYASYNATYQFLEGVGSKDITSIGGDYYSTILNIRLTDDNPFGPPVYGVHLSNPFPNKADLVVGLKSILMHFKYKLEGLSDIQISKLFKNNAKALSSLTLLVNEDNTDLSIDEIKKVYSYPVSIVKKDKIDDAILKSDSKSAFLIVIPYSNSSYTYEILSAKDCTPLGYTNDEQSTGVKVSGFGGDLGTALELKKQATKSKVKKDHFKIFAKFVK